MFANIRAFVGKLLGKPGSETLGIVATTHVAGNMPTPTETIEITAESTERATYACGHEGAATFEVSFYGEMKKPAEAYLLKRERCAACMVADARAKVIRCASCGFAICPGDPVALYVDDGQFRKEWSTRVDNNQVMGCLRWDCCPSGGFFAGHWSAGVFKPAFGGRTAVAQAYATGETVVNNRE